MALFILSTALLYLHYRVIARKRGYLNPDGLFVLVQWVMAVGTLRIIDPANAIDRQYAMLMVGCLSLYITASVATHLLLVRRRKESSELVGPALTIYRPGPQAFSLLALSALITVLYFRAVGYNVFILGVRSLLLGGDGGYDLTTLRLESYSGESYFAPGYVNQFKNALLPGLSLAVSVYLFRVRHHARVPIALFLAVLSTMGLLGTGQRNAFVLFALVAFTYAVQFTRRTYVEEKAKLKVRRYLVVAGAITLPLLFISTLILGRSDLSEAGGSAGGSLIVGQELVERVLGSNQASGVNGFRYTTQRKTQNGAEWRESLLGLSPGRVGSTLSSDLFAVEFGSTRGTAPPSLWGSAHYNFGMHGALVFAMLLGVLYQGLSAWSCRSVKTNTLELIGMSGVAVALGTWAAGDPTTPLNNGLMAFALMWWLGARRRKSKALQPASGPRNLSGRNKLTSQMTPAVRSGQLR